MEHTEAPEIFKLGKEQQVAGNVEGIDYHIVPENMKLLSTEKLHDLTAKHPRRLQQTVMMHSIDSFIEYYKRFATETSTVFFDLNQSCVTAVLDYHKNPNEPAFNLHKALYKFPTTKEWIKWTMCSDKNMDQEEFANFIEENSFEIVDPAPDQMLEITSTLKVKKDLNFKSSVRLQDGQTQYVYEETIQGTAGGAGQLTIPDKMKLQIQPFANGPAYNLEARFRHRIANQKLTMKYILIRPHRAAENAQLDIFEKVKKEMEKGQLLLGEW